MKQQLIEKVREFRNAFGLKQDDVFLHHELLQEEEREFIEAEENHDIKEMADALADCIFVAAGGLIDGFSEFNVPINNCINLAAEKGVDLPRAVDAVFTSNMSKLCSKQEIKPTADKYAFIGVDVHFEPVDELDESAGFRCICTHTVTGDDGKEYPAGKLLKSVGYKEPCWDYLSE
ncbi:MAG: hypothetical protein ACPHUL_00325 [Marinomonas gallaica]